MSYKQEGRRNRTGQEVEAGENEEEVWRMGHIERKHETHFVCTHVYVSTRVCECMRVLDGFDAKKKDEEYKREREVSGEGREERQESRET